MRYRWGEVGSGADFAPRYASNWGDMDTNTFTHVMTKHAEILGQASTDLVKSIDNHRCEIEQSTQRLIDSNLRIAISNEVYSRRLAWFTGALAFFAAVQILVSLLR
jgi:hypothetical protein